MAELFSALSQVHRDFMGDLLPRRCPRAVGIQPGQGASSGWSWVEHSHHHATAETGLEACRERAPCDANMTCSEHPGLQLRGERAV